MTAASLEVAGALMRTHRLNNVELHRGDLIDFRPQDSFDIIVSAGVIHHLEDPCKGLESLAGLLTDKGVLVIYGSITHSENTTAFLNGKCCSQCGIAPMDLSKACSYCKNSD
jgi:trans-aconitate methyltransferase